MLLRCHTLLLGSSSSSSSGGGGGSSGGLWRGLRAEDVINIEGHGLSTG